MVYITEVQMSGGSGHSHIASVRWRDPQGGKCGSSTVVAMVDWLGKDSNVACVRHGANDVRVAVVEAEPPYLRSHADGDWNDNLLALPRYQAPLSA